MVQNLHNYRLSLFGLLTVNVADGECNFPAKLLFVKLHSDDLIRESLVEEPVDLGTAGELEHVDGRGAAALDGTLKVLLQLLDALEHGLGLDGWVVRPEILVLLHFLLQRRVLLLQSVSQRRQSLANVIGQLLVQHFLKIRSSQSISHVAIGWVAESTI